MKEKRVEGILAEVEAPISRGERKPIFLTEATMAERREKVLSRMREEQLDVLVVYGDLEHGSNFEYLTGFLTRFEESALVLHQNGKAWLLLGNENTRMGNYSRIPAEVIHVPFFSLPNQPMEDDGLLEDYFVKAGLTGNQRVGLVGWKMFTSKKLPNQKLFDLPAYVVDALRAVAGEENLIHAAHLFIGGETGARITNNANEIAHYEYAAALSGDCVMRAQDQVREGITELELGTILNADGQRNSVVTIASAGQRFQYANLYPTARAVEKGVPISLTAGYRGGLTSRCGYVVESEAELPKEVEDYIPQLAKPYYEAVVTWLENIRIGMTGDELYQLIEEVLPKEEYHWFLNPGHLIGEEEWLSSPIYAGSQEALKSGMLIQIDIIPSKAGYAGAGCESGIALADEKLREEIRREYPALAEVFAERQHYIREVLHIDIPDEVLPMSDSVAYYRPFFLNKKLAFQKNI